MLVIKQVLRMWNFCWLIGSGLKFRVNVQVCSAPGLEAKRWETGSMWDRTVAVSIVRGTCCCSRNKLQQNLAVRLWPNNLITAELFLLLWILITNPNFDCDSCCFECRFQIQFMIQIHFAQNLGFRDLDYEKQIPFAVKI